ncbi:MAG: hypothetical protein Q9168_008157 [Polycauliona sp. 1 TL-2023]
MAKVETPENHRGLPQSIRDKLWVLETRENCENRRVYTKTVEQLDTAVHEYIHLLRIFQRSINDGNSLPGWWENAKKAGNLDAAIEFDRKLRKNGYEMKGKVEDVVHDIKDELMDLRRKLQEKLEDTWPRC